MQGIAGKRKVKRKDKMRRKLAACMMAIAVLTMVSGCAMSPAKQQGMLIGAAMVEAAELPFVLDLKPVQKTAK